MSCLGLLDACGTPTTCLQEQPELCIASFVDKSTHFRKQHLQRIDVRAPSLDSAGAREPGAAMAGYKTRLLVPKHAFSWANLQGMTGFSVYFAYFQTIFTRCWGCYDPAVSVPISLRPIDCEELYGRFLNTVPVHASINVSSALESVVQSCNRIVFDVIEHSGLPYESRSEAAGLKTEDFPLMFISSLVQSLSSNVRPKFPVTFYECKARGPRPPSLDRG
ncbi:hypothetical protein BDR22DRAFT_885243 [Usnea florida]